MTGPSQYTARLRHQRKDVSGLTQIFRPGVRTDSGLDRVRAIVCGYACGYSLGGLDREREVGAVSTVRITHHERQPQLAAALARQGEADQAPAVSRHEVHVLRSYAIRGHDQIAFILAVLVIHDYGHFAAAQVFEDLVDRIKGGHCF